MHPRRKNRRARYLGTVPLTETSFRAALTEEGFYVGDDHLADERSFVVFAQTPHAMIDTATWEQKAATFLKRRFGLATQKVYDHATPLSDAALAIVAEPQSQGDLRLIEARRTTTEDLRRAHRAEQLGKVGGGLFDLAKRCPMVWRVEATSDDDRASLAIATIISMVLLGPIVPPSGNALYGVRTARTKLEKTS